MTSKPKELSEFEAGLSHLEDAKRFAESKGIESSLRHISDGTGSFRGCVSNLNSYSTINMLHLWFKDHDLAAFKQSAYSAARLKYIHHNLSKMDYRAHDLLEPLLSDHDGVIDWYKTVDLFWPDESKTSLQSIPPEGEAPVIFASGPLFTRAEADDPRSFHFFAYQSILALRADWPLLEQRCLRVLADPPESERKYMVDHRFYLALARGDMPGMEAALSELTSPAVAKIRNYEFVFGYTERLISTFAVIYAKIAWRHGFELKIDTPFIPAEWLPIAPLPHYQDPYGFMAKYPMP
jgi:Immunity protein 49